MSQVNRRWLLAEHPEGRLDESHFNLHEGKLGELRDGEILIRIIRGPAPYNRAVS